MRLTVNNPDELTAVIPHMLGFAPSESLVVMPLGPDLPVGRIDLPRSAEARAEAAESLLSAYLRNAGPDSRVALVSYTDSGRAAEDASRHVAQAMTVHGLPVEFRLWATDQTWTDLDTGRGGERTREAQSRIAADFVAHGRRAPAESREGLRSALVGDPGPVAAELPAARARSNPPATERAWASERIESFERDGTRLSDTDAARLLVAVQRVEVRDDALMRMNRDTSPQHRALWSDLTARAPDEVRTPAATLAGFSAWLNGDGAGAWTALDQIPETPGGQPSGGAHDHALAGMLAQALDEGANPAAWDNSPSGPTTAGCGPAVGDLGPAYEPPDPSTATRPDQLASGPRRLPDPPTSVALQAALATPRHGEDIRMGYVSEDGFHEGYLVPQFADGQRGAGVAGGRIAPSRIAAGVEVEQLDGSWEYPTRAAGEVTGWVVCCDCCRHPGTGPASTWIGPSFTRVSSASLEDLSARRMFAADDDVALVSDIDQVADVARDLWSSEHVFGGEALGEVEAAEVALSSAKQRLDTAVMMARSSGASWTTVARSTSMSRQSAHERWNR